MPGLLQGFAYAQRRPRHQLLVDAMHIRIDALRFAGLRGLREKSVVTRAMTRLIMCCSS